MTAILTGVKWYFTVVLIYISWLVSDAEHLFMCLLAHLHVFFGELLRFSAHFWIGLFWYWAIWVVCIFWKLIPCHSHHLQIFSPILYVVLLFCLSVLWCAKAFKFKSYLFIFVFISITLGNRSKKYWCDYMSKSVLCFPAEVFIVSSLF